jgi:predicted hotdog family 3-hydroxylacyl-ACP dehydratase
MSGVAIPAPFALIPHRHDALLLDEVLRVDESGLSAALTIRSGTAFSEADGSLPAWIGPEIMAEAIAAFAGWRSLQSRGEPAEIGLLLGIRDYSSAAQPFRAGELMQVHVVRSSEDEEGRGVFDCRISLAGDDVAAGTLTVYQPTDGSFLAAQRDRDD